MLETLPTALGMGIVDFFEAPWLLNDQELSPIQKVILKSMRGEQLDDSMMIPLEHPYQMTEGPFAREKPFESEVEMFKWFTGKEEYIPKIYYDADLCLGRRSGKSTKIGAGLALFFATQYDYGPYLRTSPWATIPIISPTKEQAGEVFASIKTMILRSSYLYENFLGGNVNGFSPEYSEEGLEPGKLVGGVIRLTNKVHIKVMAADVSKIRGMAVPFAILDEVCFFGREGNDAKNTDKGIYEALAPALSQFQEVEGMAMILKISSPDGQSGLMFENFENSKDPDVLHFQVPTWYANPRIAIKYLEKQKKKGAAYFNREYGAQYVASETSYLDPEMIDATIIRGAERIDPMKHYRYVAAMDYATKDDLWTFGIGHKEYVFDTDLKAKVERVQADLLVHWRGISGQELNPAEIIPQICTLMKHYRVNYCVSDQYAFAALRPLFQRYGCTLKEFKVTHASKLQFMYSLQVAVNSNALRMVHNPIAVRHLKDLREKRSNLSNKIRIEHAQNCKDDYADVIGLIVFQFDKTSPLYVGMNTEPKEGPKNTKDGLGKQLLYPTAEEMAEKHGVVGFYDNREEFEAKKEEEEKGEDPDNGDSLWFIF